MVDQDDGISAAGIKIPQTLASHLCRRPYHLSNSNLIADSAAVVCCALCSELAVPQLVCLSLALASFPIQLLEVATLPLYRPVDARVSSTIGQYLDGLDASDPTSKSNAPKVVRPLAKPCKFKMN